MHTILTYTNCNTFLQIDCFIVDQLEYQLKKIKKTTSSDMDVPNSVKCFQQIPQKSTGS